MRGSLTRLAGGTLAALLAVSLSACGSSSHSPNGATPELSIPHASGVDAELVFSSSFTSVLKPLGVKLAAIKPAVVDATAGTVKLPISQGSLTYYKPGSTKHFAVGSMVTRGGLSLSLGSTTISLSKVRVDLTASKVTGDVTVGGKLLASNIELFVLDESTMKPIQRNTPATGDDTLSGAGVEVAPQVASALSKVVKATVPADFLVGTLVLQLAD